ncbi:glycoside hydrolase family 2 protein [Paenibacillus sp. TAB 01]|uniref:glycoside hydrolase family 2 protein n=1 Tax=Paenibacillus sp. TAB 01 TaxID=3368988 RepID=UPI0037538DD8
MHNWGNFYNATKDPQFVTETCWNLDSYSRPETLKACMGLDVEQFNERGWHHKWKELTSHELHTKFPFSDYHHAATLKDYLRSLEIEHAQSDYHALSYLRLRSSSCSGILYWSLNKGGPLFGFGCVDYKGIPMMSYYTLKRVLSDVLVGIHRYMDDIHVVASNLTREPIQGQIRVTHMNAEGRVIKQWQQPDTVASDETRRVFTLESYYREILDRTNEVIHVQWIIGDVIVSDDTLFFCTLSEFEPVPNPIRIKVLKTDRTDAWTLEIEGESVSKLLMLEGSHKMLCSDNYFTLAPGTKKQIDVEILERTGDEEGLRLTVSSLDVPGEIVLELK